MEDAIDTHVSLFGYSASMAYGTLTDAGGLFLTKWPMKNINRLQIEIYGVKELLDTLAPISCTTSYVVTIVKIASGAGGR